MVASFRARVIRVIGAIGRFRGRIEVRYGVRRSGEMRRLLKQQRMPIRIEGLVHMHLIYGGLVGCFHVTSLLWRGNREFCSEGKHRNYKVRSIVARWLVLYSFASGLWWGFRYST